MEMKDRGIGKNVGRGKETGRKEKEEGKEGKKGGGREKGKYSCIHNSCVAMKFMTSGWHTHNNPPFPPL